LPAPLRYAGLHVLLGEMSWMSFSDGSWVPELSGISRQPLFILSLVGHRETRKSSISALSRSLRAFRICVMRIVRSLDDGAHWHERRIPDALAVR
jgi:hypothetical protein